MAYNTGGTGAALFAEEPVETKQAPPPTFTKEDYGGDEDIDMNRYNQGGTGGPGQAKGLTAKFFPNIVQQGLALAKMFYFFFFAAFGSLFPLMAVYFKQQGMDAAQTGMVIGIRPIVEYIATPIWRSVSEKLQKGKIMLLVAVASWIIFTIPIGVLDTPVVRCKIMNGSELLIGLPQYKRSHNILDTKITIGDNTVVRQKQPGAKDELWQAWTSGRTSPQTIHFKYHYSDDQHTKDWISPTHSNKVFERQQVHKMFFLILLLVVIGEFFSSPALPLADSAVVTLLGPENQDKYGSQRMFGSLGWGITMFIMGMVLDHYSFENSTCDLHQGEKNYHVCFAVFAGIMSCAFIVATQIPFNYTSVSTGTNPAAVPMSNMQQPNGGAKGQQKDKMEELKEKTKHFASELRGLPEFNAIFRLMTNLRVLCFFIVAWIMGIGMGLIFTFLFWHLQDYGGGPTLFGIASVINHISEMFAYLYAVKIIGKLGHIKVLAAGLLCNCLRFLYISFITWPWLVLPFEFVQGITHSAVWAACSSFIAHNTEPELRSSAQSVLQLFHTGLGKFCGSIIGGILIKEHGAVKVFFGYGILSGVFLVIFCLVNFYSRNEGGINTDLPDDMDPKNVELTGAAFAPHGVPGAAMPRALSSANVEEYEQAQVDTSGPSLGVPGQEKNPFLAEDASYDASGQRIQGGNEQYYGRGYSQAQSGYSSSGFGLQ